VVSCTRWESAEAACCRPERGAKRQVTVRNAEVEGSTPFRSTCNKARQNKANLFPVGGRWCGVSSKRITVHTVCEALEVHTPGPFWYFLCPAIVGTADGSYCTKASKVEFDRLIGEWLAGGRHPLHVTAR
jgi:hypothetical protein